MPYNAYRDVPNMLHADNGRVVGDTLKNEAAVVMNSTPIMNIIQADYSKNARIPYAATEHPYRKFNVPGQVDFIPQGKM